MLSHWARLSESRVCCHSILHKHIFDISFLHPNLGSWWILLVMVQAVLISFSPVQSLDWLGLFLEIGQVMGWYFGVGL